MNKWGKEAANLEEEDLLVEEEKVSQYFLLPAIARLLTPSPYPTTSTFTRAEGSERRGRGFTCTLCNQLLPQKYRYFPLMKYKVDEHYLGIPPLGGRPLHPTGSSG